MATRVCVGVVAVVCPAAPSAARTFSGGRGFLRGVENSEATGYYYNKIPQKQGVVCCNSEIMCRFQGCCVGVGSTEQDVKYRVEKVLYRLIYRSIKVVVVFSRVAG